LTVSSHRSPPPLFFYNAPPPPQIYTLSLHDALPISRTTPPTYARRRISSRISRAIRARGASFGSSLCDAAQARRTGAIVADLPRSEEHTSELQSLAYLVCRLLLEKKKNI